MSKSRKLDPVIEMARKATEQALISLGESNALLQRELTQLEELMQYRNEYLQRFRQNDPLVMSAKKALELRGFLAQLDQAIQSQEHQVSESRQRVDHQQADWIAARNKEQALDSLMSKYVADENHKQQRREQRESDEHTNANWLRLHRD